MISLSEDHIHLWQGTLSEILPRVQLEHLSEAERLKVPSLRNKTMQTQFLVSRWLTRHVLSRYLQITPAEVPISQSENGKPDIDGTPIKFNRSHSGDRIVLAIGSGSPVGVDIEAITERPQMAGIVQRWFEPEERETFLTLPESQRPAFFYSGWTEKEAVLKAWGWGLSRLSVYSKTRKISSVEIFTPSAGFAGCVAWASREAKTVSFYSI